MCRDIEGYLQPARCWVHPGTTLVRSACQHLRRFEILRNKTLVIIHIGTNDIAAGATATTVLQRMQTLIKSITQVNQQAVYFAVSAILPRMTDDSTTKSTVKQCNRMIKHWSSHTNNILFLNTTKLFLKNGKINYN
ncbi:MAG: SGNH/GDSL hydrolase family protein, partial [Plesiomonas sp.]|uniref:SGNH/GDSL hydrolase family protein n=1 Tax=Plesiomonas sp. TaxID=2486279 RepID=UPI003F37D39F